MFRLKIKLNDLVKSLFLHCASINSLILTYPPLPRPMPSVYLFTYYIPVLYLLQSWGTTCHQQTCWCLMAVGLFLWHLQQTGILTGCRECLSPNAGLPSIPMPIETAAQRLVPRTQITSPEKPRCSQTPPRPPSLQRTGRSTETTWPRTPPPCFHTTLAKSGLIPLKTRVKWHDIETI